MGAIEVDGVRLFYKSRGSGPLTVLVPAACWLERDLEFLADAHRVVFYDQRNRGRSEGLLCRRHHRLVHEGGYGLTIDSLGRRRFCRPNGTEITTAAPTELVVPLEGPVLDPPPVWNGDRLDLDLTVQLLCHADELRRRRN